MNMSGWDPAPNTRRGTGVTPTTCYGFIQTTLVPSANIHFKIMSAHSGTPPVTAEPAGGKGQSDEFRWFKELAEIRPIMDFEHGTCYATW